MNKVDRARMAVIDVRDDASLSISNSLLQNGRASGIYASARSCVAIGSQVNVWNMKLAALEVTSSAQIICQTIKIAQIFSLKNDDDDDTSEVVEVTNAHKTKPLSSGSVYNCGVSLLLGQDAALGYLEKSPHPSIE
jgi:hypothetical protein